MEDYPRDLLEFESRFATEEACRDYLFALRWPDEFRCPSCGHERAWPVRKVWFECARCDLHIVLHYATGQHAHLWFEAAGAMRLTGALGATTDRRRVRNAGAASLMPFVEEFAVCRSHSGRRRCGQPDRS